MLFLNLVLILTYKLGSWIHHSAPSITNISWYFWAAVILLVPSKYIALLANVWILLCLVVFLNLMNGTLPNAHLTWYSDMVSNLKYSIIIALWHTAKCVGNYLVLEQLKTSLLACGLIFLNYVYTYVYINLQFYW